MKNNQSLFTLTNAIGKNGEEEVKNYYRKKGVKVIDVSDDIEYQKKDIDLLLNGQPVEVKVGAKIPQYKEICLEIVSNALPDRYKDGWFLTTQAEVIIFYSPIEKKMYQLSVAELRDYYEMNKEKLKTKHIYVNEFGNFMKPAVLAFIPLDEIEENISAYRTITIE